MNYAHCGYFLLFLNNSTRLDSWSDCSWPWHSRPTPGRYFESCSSETRSPFSRSSPPWSKLPSLFPGHESARAAFARLLGSGCQCLAVEDIWPKNRGILSYVLGSILNEPGLTSTKKPLSSLVQVGLGLQLGSQSSHCLQLGHSLAL